MDYKCNKQSGQALMTTVIFLLFISLAVVLGITVSSMSASVLARDFIDSKKSYFLAEAGAEDLAYRISHGMNYSSEEAVSFDGFFATTTVIDVAGDIEINSTGDVSKNIRKIKLSLTNATGVSFHYGLQAGEGGVRMEQSAMVTGNLYSNGPVLSMNKNKIWGDVISAGPAGSITGVVATGTAYAHSIADSTIGEQIPETGDAYYVNINNTTVYGDLYPNSPDQPFADMPISDDLINDWKNIASKGTVITAPCPYVISEDTTMGPAKIECDLDISGTNFALTLTGPIWVVGNITVRNSAEVKISPSLGRKSIAIIADNPANNLTSGKISLEQSISFHGSGSAGSYVLVISQNNSAENGGSEHAILVQNTASGDLLLYAPHGEIYLNNRSDLREVTAYKLLMRNQANVIYETGLANLLFSSGPGGGFSIISWREVE